MGSLLKYGIIILLPLIVSVRSFLFKIESSARNVVLWRKGSIHPGSRRPRACPWMNAPAFGRDVAPLGPEEGCHGLCPWGSTIRDSPYRVSCVEYRGKGRKSFVFPLDTLSSTLFFCRSSLACPEPYVVQGHFSFI